MTSRRSFLAALAAAFVIDPERALWVPGAKTISVPAVRVYGPVFLAVGDVLTFGDWPERFIVTAAAQSLATIADARFTSLEGGMWDLRFGDTIGHRDGPARVHPLTDGIHWSQAWTLQTLTQDVMRNLPIRLLPASRSQNPPRRPANDPRLALAAASAALPVKAPSERSRNRTARA